MATPNKALLFAETGLVRRNVLQAMFTGCSSGSFVDELALFVPTGEELWERRCCPFATK